MEDGSFGIRSITWKEIQKKKKTDTLPLLSQRMKYPTILITYHIYR